MKPSIANILLHENGSSGGSENEDSGRASRDLQITRMSCLRYAVAIVADEKEHTEKKAELATKIAKKFERYILK